MCAPFRNTGTNGFNSAVSNESTNLLPGAFISVPTMIGKWCFSANATTS